MPAMQAQLASMQNKIDQRQDALDQNEDRIANIILNSPKSQASEKPEPKEEVDALAEKEKQLREQDVLQQDAISDGGSEKQ